MKAPTLAAAALASLAVVLPTSNAKAETAVTLQAGAGPLFLQASLELEVLAPFGLFADLGVTNDGPGGHPFHLKLGYQHALTESFKLRAGVRASPPLVAACTGPVGECEEWQPGALTTVMAEVGLRYEHRSGFAAGIELPLFGATELHWASGRGASPWTEYVSPPGSLRFARTYVGWGLRF